MKVPRVSIDRSGSPSVPTDWAGRTLSAGFTPLEMPFPDACRLPLASRSTCCSQSNSTRDCRRTQPPLPEPDRHLSMHPALTALSSSSPALYTIRCSKGTYYLSGPAPLPPVSGIAPILWVLECSVAMRVSPGRRSRSLTLTQSRT